MSLQIIFSYFPRILPGVGLGAAVAEEVAELGIRHVVSAVAHPRAHRTDSDAVHHLACMTVVPVLVHELALSYSERAELVLKHRVFVLYETASEKIIYRFK